MSMPRALFCLLLLAAAPGYASTGPLQILTYHDVVQKMEIGINRDEMAVTTRGLAEHFRWLREQGYQPISIDQLEAANNGGAPLPDKPVLLTFDDGLISTYTKVFPLLKLFNYPAVVSVVTDWLESDTPVLYAKRLRGKEAFLSWSQIREMQASGLVEIASHSHSLHQGIRVNQQGNTQPAAIGRLYLEGNYESDESRRQRVLDDLLESVEIISAKTGKVPRIMTWPYGAYNYIGASAARELGLQWALTLDPNFGNPTDTKTLHRHLIKDNPSLREFSSLVLRIEEPPLIRAARLDLDNIYDEDPLQQERNLDLMVERMARLRISHVFLQAFSDLDADGAAEALYFPNRHLPMRADLFNRVAWQLKTRAEVTIFAWMPMLSFTGGNVQPATQALLSTTDNTDTGPGPAPRLSPFVPEARQYVSDLYHDLARHAQFEGLHFDDNILLDQHEVDDDTDLRAYRAQQGADLDFLALQDSAGVTQRSTELNTQALIDFTDELANVVRPYQPRLQTSRNLLAHVPTKSDGATLLAQDYGRFLDRYDFVTILPVPFSAHGEKAPLNASAYQVLADRARLQDPALGRTVFQVQTVDWNRQEPIPAGDLKNTFRMLQTIGVRNLAYYPDNFLHNEPDLSLLRQGISMAEELLRSQP